MANTLENKDDSVIIVALDCEMTGPDLTRNALGEIGIAVMEAKTRKLLTRYEVLIGLPEGREWDNQCVEEFWKAHSTTRTTMAALDNGEGYAPEEAMLECQDFLLTDVFDRICKKDPDRLQLVAGPSDINWINLYLNLYTTAPSLQALFGGVDKPIINLNSYALAKTNLTFDEIYQLKKQTKGRFNPLAVAKNKLNLNKIEQKYKHDHSAANDAAFIAEALSILMYPPS